MIAYLSGTILDQSIDRVILDVQGVGYEVWVPVGTQGRLESSEDGRVGVHVHTSVREDAIQLFGFGTPDEKRVFEKLLSVSGVGPKLALSVLSTLGPMELLQAVESNDLASLTKVSGVGKRTAQRLILELKSKFDGFALDKLAPSAGVGGKLIEDLRSALQNLGYAPQVIESACDHIAPRADEFEAVEDALREAFKLLR